MRYYLLFILGLTIGILAGQVMTQYAYDPTVLEGNALGFAASAYDLGCAEAGKQPGTCREKAGKYLKDMTEIFTDKVWERR